MLFPGSHSGFNNVLTRYTGPYILTNIRKAHLKRLVQLKVICFFLSSNAKLQEYKTHIVQAERFDFSVISLKTLQANPYSQDAILSALTTLDRVHIFAIFCCPEPNKTEINVFLDM